jgi:hypothetical protein
MGIKYEPNVQTHRLSLPRAGGLIVEPNVARTYEQLIPLVQSHAVGKFIYAAPDCPEVYFLSGFQSPTRYYFDYADDLSDRYTRILQALDQLGVKVIVLNKEPKFSGPIPQTIRDELTQRFRRSTAIGSFEVRWRE